MTDEKSAMSDETVDADRLRQEVRDKYRDVALDPQQTFDFYTGRPLAERLGYPRTVIESLPDRAVESFAGGDGDGIRREHGAAFSQPAFAGVACVNRAGFAANSSRQ
jgi:hypothetical protein